jgi:TnpA family transposase
LYESYRCPDLVARFEQINKMRLYLPGRGDQHDYPLLSPALTRPIRWDDITHDYDLMMRYATAVRLRTASTEALLRRFTSETTHPAYAAMLEVGRARRTIFLARALGIHADVAVAWQRPSSGGWAAYAVEAGQRSPQEDTR